MTGDGVISAAIGGGAEGRYRTAKTSVWWDIEKCKVPEGLDIEVIIENISRALVKMNYCGPISISAYANTNFIPHSIQQALRSAGISLTHVPAGVEDARDNNILVDMLFWAVDNPAPANYLLISGDKEFSFALHQLQMRRYNILLAQPPHASVALVPAAKSVWHWTSLLSGGFPFASSELLQLANRNDILHPATSQGLAHDAFQMNQTACPYSENILQSNHKFLNPAVAGDATDIGNNFLKNKTNQPLVTRALSIPVDIQDENILRNTTQPEKAPVKQFMRAPHEFFGVSEPVIPARSSPTLFPCNSDLSGNSASFNTSREQQNQYTQMQKVSVFNNRNGGIKSKFVESSYVERPCVHQHGIILQEIQLLSHDRPEAPPLLLSSLNTKSDNGIGSAQGCQPPSDYIQGLIGVVLLALHYLKQEKLIPTKANINNCIRYGDPKFSNTDVGKALNFALEHQMILKQSLGAVYLYVSRSEKLWKCVNPVGGDQHQYPKATWDAVQNFLSSSAGRSAMMASYCRYEAGLILKNSCLQNLALGEVLQILNMIISEKRWIKHTQPGWQPITITLAEIKSDASTDTDA